jgi:cytosine/uracil/thiamine/allantoin permease
MSIGFTAREVIPLTFAGFFICGFVVSLTGKIAATYHVPFPVIARSSLYVPVLSSHSLSAYCLLL